MIAGKSDTVQGATISFRCVLCGITLEAGSDLSGIEVSCPACSARITVPPDALPPWDGAAVTEVQLAFIRSFGVRPFEGITRGEAGRLIDLLRETQRRNEFRIAQFVRNFRVFPESWKESIRERLRGLGTADVDAESAAGIIVATIPQELHPITRADIDFSRIADADGCIETFLRVRHGLAINADGCRALALRAQVQGWFMRLASLHRHCEVMARALPEGAGPEEIFRLAERAGHGEVCAYLEELVTPYIPNDLGASADAARPPAS